MSDTLRDLILPTCQGKTAFLGIGSIDREDDGVGVKCAGMLIDAGVDHVFIGATVPEKIIPAIRDGGFDSIVLLDAVDAGSEPGAVMVCDAGEIENRFPQISTHKLSMSLLERLLTDGNQARVWLVGIQPQSVERGRSELSGVVGETAALLARSFEDCLSATPSAIQEHLCM